MKRLMAYLIPDDAFSLGRLTLGHGYKVRVARYMQEVPLLLRRDDRRDTVHFSDGQVCPVVTEQRWEQWRA